MNKSFFLLLSTLSFDTKAAPKLRANGLRIFLEQAGKIAHEKLSRLMLICKNFNGAAENLTRQKTPLSWIDLSSRLSFNFKQLDLDKFHLIKDMILNSSKIKTHLSFRYTPYLENKNMISILEHPSIQENLQSLSILDLCLDAPFKNALQNLKELKALSLVETDFHKENIPIGDNLINLEISHSKNIPASFWRALQDHFKKEKKDAQGNTSVIAHQFKRLNFSGCHASPAFWNSLSACFYLESLNVAETNFSPGRAPLSTFLKVLNLSYCRNIHNFKFLENLNEIENLNLSNTDFKGENITLSSTLRHLNISHCFDLKKSFLKSLEKLNRLEILELAFLNLKNDIFFPESLQCLNLKKSDIKPANFQKLSALKNLRYLDFSEINFKNHHFSLPLNVEYLNLASCTNSAIVDSMDRVMYDLPEPTELDYVNYFIQETKELGSILVNLQELRKLKVLKISHTKFTLDQTIFPSSLEKLNLLGSVEPSRNFFSNLSTLTQLQKLNISSIHFSKINVLSLPSCLKELRINQCTKDSDLFFSELSKLTQLEALYMSNTFFSKENVLFPPSLKILCMIGIKCHLDFWENLDNLSLLEELYVDNTNFTGQTKPSGKTLIFPKLRILSVSNMHRLSKDFLANIQESFVKITKDDQMMR